MKVIPFPLDRVLRSTMQHYAKVIPLRFPNSCGATADILYHQATQIDEDPKHYNRAIQLYMQVLLHNPDHFPAVTNMGCTFYRRGKEGDLEKARRAWRKVYGNAKADSADRSIAYYNMAQSLFDEGAEKEAYVYLVFATELDPTFADASYLLALVCMNQKRHREATKHFLSALRNGLVEPFISEAERFLKDISQ